MSFDRATMSERQTDNSSYSVADEMRFYGGMDWAPVECLNYCLPFLRFCYSYCAGITSCHFCLEILLI